MYVCIERFEYQQLEKRQQVTGVSGLGASKQSVEVWRVRNWGRTINLKAHRSRCQQLKEPKVCAAMSKCQLLEKKPWFIEFRSLCQQLEEPTWEKSVDASNLRRGCNSQGP